MKSRILLYVSFLLIILFSSCEKVIDFNGKTPDPLIVLNSIVMPDSIITVQLTQSKFFLSNSTGFTNIGNALVTITVNDTLVQNLTNNGNGNYQSSYIAKANDVIKITASAPKLKSVKAEVVVQPQITILSIDTTWLGASTDANNYSIIRDSLYEEIGKIISQKIEVKIRFKDNSHEKNYYRLNAYIHTIHYYKWGTGEYQKHEYDDYYNINYNDIVFGNTSENDPMGMESGGYGNSMFTDELINGKEYSLTIQTNATIQQYYPGKKPTEKSDKQTLIVDFQQLSPSYYLYVKTSNASSSADIFAEPVQIYTNVENGLGILGSYTKKINQYEF